MHRTRLELSETLLQTIQREPQRPHTIKCALRTNYNTTKELLTTLEAQGLVIPNSPEYAITDEGRILLDKLRQLRRIYDWRA